MFVTANAAHSAKGGGHPSYNSKRESSIEEPFARYSSQYFPVRPLIRIGESDGAWLVAHKAEEQRRFNEILRRQRPSKKTNSSNTGTASDAQSGAGSRIKEQLEEDEATCLDGFYLMRLMKVEDPSFVCNIDVSGRSLVEVKEEDLQLFDSVTSLKAGENMIRMEPLNGFTSLRELEIPFNGLRNLQITAEMFPNLEYLDVSYNELSTEDIFNIGLLQNLRRLHASGNGLRRLPDDLVLPDVNDDGDAKQRYQKLEYLLLDDNQLSDPNVFASLAGLRRLKVLSLERNQFTSVPFLKSIAPEEMTLSETTSGRISRKSKSGRRSARSSRSASTIEQPPKADTGLIVSAKSLTRSNKPADEVELNSQMTKSPKANSPTAASSRAESRQSQTVRVPSAGGIPPACKAEESEKEAVIQQGSQSAANQETVANEGNDQQQSQEVDAAVQQKDESTVSGNETVQAQADQPVHELEKEQGEQQTEMKDEHQSEHKNEQQNDQKSEQESEQKSEKRDNEQSDQKNEQKNEQQCEQKNDQQSEQKNDQQSEQKDEQQNEQNNDQQSEQKDEQQSEQKDDQQSEQKDGQQSEQKDKQQSEQDEQQSEQKDEHHIKQKDEQQSEQKEAQQSEQKDEQLSEQKNGQQNGQNQEQKNEQKEEKQNEQKGQQQTESPREQTEEQQSVLVKQEQQDDQKDPINKEETQKELRTENDHLVQPQDEQMEEQKEQNDQFDNFESEGRGMKQNQKTNAEKPRASVAVSELNHQINELNLQMLRTNRPKSAPLVTMATFDLRAIERAIASRLNDDDDDAAPPPFPSLRSLNLGQNRISREESLVAVGVWPVLSELLIYDNPLSRQRSGEFLLLQRMLTNRLGIRILKQKPQQRPKPPIEVQPRPSRKVRAVVPKVPKVDVDSLLLSIKAPTRSSADQNQENPSVNVPSGDAEVKDNESCWSDEEAAPNGDGVFMTSVNDQRAEASANAAAAAATANDAPVETDEFDESHLQDLLFSGTYDDSSDAEELPNDVLGSVKALEYLLNHPVTLEHERPPLAAAGATYREHRPSRQPPAPPRKSRKQQIAEALDATRQAKPEVEVPLAKVLQPKAKLPPRNRRQLEPLPRVEAERLLASIQQKYHGVRDRSLQMAKKQAKENMSEMVEEIRTNVRDSLLKQNTTQDA